MMCGNGHLDGQVIAFTSKSIHHDHIVDLVVLFDGQPTGVPIPAAAFVSLGFRDGLNPSDCCSPPHIWWPESPFLHCEFTVQHGPFFNAPRS